MHWHNFQVTELKLYRLVKDSTGQVVKGLTIIRHTMEISNIIFFTPRNVNSASIPTVYR